MNRLTALLLTVAALGCAAPSLEGAQAALEHAAARAEGLCPAAKTLQCALVVTDLAHARDTVAKAVKSGTREDVARATAAIALLEADLEAAR